MYCYPYHPYQGHNPTYNYWNNQNWSNYLSPRYMSWDNSN